MTITISAPHLIMLAICIALFVATTVFCVWQGLFDGNDQFGIGEIFKIAAYAVFWIIPSLTMWAVWATWIRQ